VRLAKWIITLLLLIVLQTSVHAQTFIYLPVIMCMNNCDNNSWQIVKYLNEARINYVLNPSAETTGNFSAVAGATVTRSTTYQKYGPYSYRVQAGATNDGISLTLGTLTNSNHTVSVRVRNLAKGELVGQVGTGQHTLQLVGKIDKQWNLYSAEFSAGETNGQTNLNILASTNMDVYIDGLQVEPGQLTTYIDGSQEGCEWLGPEHAAVSRRSGGSKAGGEPVDFYEEYGFRIEEIIDAGASPLRLGIDQYAILPGGELNSEKILPREFTLIGKFIAESEEELHAKRQALRLEFQTLGGQATKIRFSGAQVQKEISAYYAGGLEGKKSAFYGGWEIIDDDKWGKAELYTEKASIQLQAPNPFWYEIGESAALLDTQDSATFRYVAGRLRSTGQWSNLGPPSASGTYTNINDFAEDETYVYITGNFTNFDNIANADYIVRWHKVDQVYSALGTGLNASGIALWLSDNGVLYVVGSFTTAGGSGANRIAAWDTVSETWAALGSGLGGIARDVVVDDNDILYVVGDFTTLGSGGAANRIASWDIFNGTWSALGSGLNNQGLSLGVLLDGTTILAGGQFTTAGGSAANYIAAWDSVNSAWSALGNGLGAGGAFVIQVDPDTGIAYIGGSFTVDGDGNLVNFIVAWNGVSFVPLSSGMDNIVFDVSIAPDKSLWASGIFTEAGGLSLTNRISRWNGSAWTHIDLELGGTPSLFAIYASKYHDPLIKQRYSVFVGASSLAGVTSYYGGLVTVNNSGTVAARPTIIFTRTGGSTTTITKVRNETTGKEISINYSLKDGETLVIDLTPTSQSVVSLPSTRPKPGAVLPASDLGTWALLPGSNDITCYVDTGSGIYAAAVTARLLWQDAYDGYD
jgi:hypothetical protein